MPLSITALQNCMSLNNARLFNSDLVLIDVMLHFLNIQNKCLFNSSELSCGFNIIIIFQNEKKDQHQYLECT